MFMHIVRTYNRAYAVRLVSEPSPASYNMLHAAVKMFGLNTDDAVAGDTAFKL